MKKFCLLFSFLVMTAMLLFLGGCQREEEIVNEKNQQDNPSLVLDSTMLSKFLFKNNGDFNKGLRFGSDLPSADSLVAICHLILKQDSTHHFLANFLETFGYPDWSHSFYFSEYRQDNQIINIPFIKDNKITGILQYFSEFEDKGLIFHSNQRINVFINDNTSLTNYYRSLGIVALGEAKVRYQDSLSNEMNAWLKNFYTNNKYQRLNEGPRIRTICRIVKVTTEYWYENDKGKIYAKEVEYYVICHEVDDDFGGYNNPGEGINNPFNYPHNPHWWEQINTGHSAEGTSWVYKSSQQINIEEAQKRKKALDECVMSQNDVATEKMINEALDDIVFPCLDEKSVMLKKAALKEAIKTKWCEDNYDNPGALLPDGSHVKPKMSEADIDKALGSALKYESNDYIVPSPELLNCKFYSCIYDELVKHADPTHCKSLFNVLTNKKIKTTLTTSDLSGMQTTLSDDKNSIIIKVSDDYCDKDDPWYDDKANEVLAAAQLLHEFIHADWIQTLLAAGKNPEKIGSYVNLWPQYESYLKEIYKSSGSIESVQHAIMLHIENTIRKIATDLFYLFNGESLGLTVDHFMMAGANGLFDFMDSKTKSNFLSKYQLKSQEMNNFVPQLTFNCK